MSRPPSPRPPSSRYYREAQSASHSNPSPPHVQHSSQHYSHPSTRGHAYPDNTSASPGHSSADRDAYHRPPHAEDPYYYTPPPPTTHHPYGHSPHQSPSYRHQSPEYLHQRSHLPPPPHPPAPPAPPAPPHPPAPPAPPRSQPYRPSYQLSPVDPSSSRPNLVPTFTYYRAHAQYNMQHVSAHLDHQGASSLTLDTEPRVGMLRPDTGLSRARSESTGSGGYSSGIQEYIDGDLEPTPSPIDPSRIQQWEDEHATAPSQRTSSGSGSYLGEDEDREDSIDPSLDILDPSLDVLPQGFYSPVVRPDGSIDPGSASLEMPYSQKRANSDYYPSPHHQAQFQSLIHKPGSVNSQRGSIGLNSLVDAEPGDRPAYPIPTIIKCAILGSPHQQLTLSELYLAMEMRFDYYRNTDKKSWRNSVRHNLSLNNQFDKKDRPITEPGKGHYWVVAPNRPQGNKRERKRNKKPGKRALAAMAAEEERLAHEQQDDEPAVSPPVNAHPSGTTTIYPAAVRGYSSGTLPASAGSYAAVTGALPTPPPPDMQNFRPWEGNAQSASPASPASPVSSARPASPAPPVPPAQPAPPTPQSPPKGVRYQPYNKGRRPRSPLHAPERRQPQFGEPSLRPGGYPSPARRPDGAFVQHQSGSVSAESSSSAGYGDHRSPRSETLVSVLKAPANAFSELASQIEREGTGAMGSGGPALSTLGKRKRGRGRNGESDSDDDEPSDEYLPHKTRIRTR